jgi:hypothetical protein
MVSIVRYLVLLISLVASSLATAQVCTGDFPAGTACGNVGATANPPSPIPVTVDVDGMSSLRTRAVVDGQTLHLKFHTAAGDQGAGYFVGKQGPGGPGYYKDNNGTIIVPTGGDGSGAWLRIWDGQNADMGWWGAKFDHVTDDYNAWAQAVSLFSTRGGCAQPYCQINAVLNIHGGFNHSRPLVFTGDQGAGLTITGNRGLSIGGNVQSYLNYTGPTTKSQVVFMVANWSYIKNVSLVMNNALNGVHFNTDYGVCIGGPCSGTNRLHITSPVNPGTNVNIPVQDSSQMTPGIVVELGYQNTASVDDFEVVEVTSVADSTHIVVRQVYNAHASPTSSLFGGFCARTAGERRLTP